MFFSFRSVSFSVGPIFKNISFHRFGLRRPSMGTSKMEDKSTPASSETSQRGISFDTNVVDNLSRTLSTQLVDSLTTKRFSNTVQYMVAPTAKSVRILSAEDDLTAEKFVQEIRAVYRAGFMCDLDHLIWIHEC